MRVANRDSIKRGFTIILKIIRGFRRRTYHICAWYNSYEKSTDFLPNTTPFRSKSPGLVHLDWTHHDNLFVYVPSRTLASLLQHRYCLPSPESDSALYQYTSIIAFPCSLLSDARCIDSVRYHITGEESNSR